MTNTDITTILPLRPGRWVVDHAHSTVGFTIRHLGVAKVRGRFSDFDAVVDVGPDAAATTVEATVQLASIDTGNADRDAHVRATDMLDVERRPTMAFRSSAVSGAGDDWQLTGELTIGEVSRPFALAVEFGGLEEFPGGGRHAGFEATGTLRRSDFGLDLGLPPGLGNAMLSDTIRIEIDLELLEPLA